LPDQGEQFFANRELVRDHALGDERLPSSQGATDRRTATSAYSAVATIDGDAIDAAAVFPQETLSSLDDQIGDIASPAHFQPR